MNGTNQFSSWPADMWRGSEAVLHHGIKEGIAERSTKVKREDESLRVAVKNAIFEYLDADTDVAVNRAAITEVISRIASLNLTGHRYAPNGSTCNKVEKLMSVLNVGLDEKSYIHVS